MRSVGIKVLKNKLSEYVRIAAGGETVLVTDRDRVVAQLVPPDRGREAYPDNPVLAQMVREGRLTPAPDRGKPLPPSPRGIMSLDKLMRQIESDREDR
jgi:antitoxin (DNA-binding transcriptional repressor) of toxin-antitoxin stability system